MFGILFDLDGTLLDTLDDLVDSVNYALAQYNYPSRTQDEIRSFIGNGAAVLAKLSTPEGEDYVPVLRAFQAHYKTHCQIKTGPYKGVTEALACLKGKYPMAIVSNKPDSAVKPLCEQYFPGIYALGERPGCPRKPSADMVYGAMKDIGVDTCVYVGDSEVDIATAKNAGVKCLSVLWGFRDKDVLIDAGGAYFCEDTAQLVAKLEELIHG